VKRFPRAFSDLLTKEGRRVLDGKHPTLSGALATGRSRWVGSGALLDAKKSRALATLLDGALGTLLFDMEQPIPRGARGT
jgi:hypothetical protein